MRQSEAITLLDGKSFLVQQLPARAALKLMRRLGKVFAPALALLASNGKVSLANTDISSLGTSLEKVFEELTDEDLDHFTERLLAGCLVDGKYPVLSQIDVLFQGETLDLIKLLIHAVKVNYASFFNALRDEKPAPLAG